MLTPFVIPNATNVLQAAVDRNTRWAHYERWPRLPTLHFI